MREGLYAIVDVDAWRARGVELGSEGVLEAIAEGILGAKPSMLQLRAKQEDARTTLALLRRLRPLTRRAGVPLVANDRVDLALLADADVVHVGQDDLALADVRRIAPSLQVGLSTHDERQLDEAIAAAPSYVAFGPVFGTKSKREADPTVGTARLASAVERAQRAHVPLVAIGGITHERLAEVASSGARWVAVIGALVVLDARGRPDVAAIEARARGLAAIGERA